MMEDNEHLNRFFAEMKEHDKTLDIPVFQPKKPQKYPWWIPLGIAASLAVIFLLRDQKEIMEYNPKEVVIITLYEDENHNQKFAIEETTHLDSWESPTASLLTDF